MYTGRLNIPTNRYCDRCGSKVYHSDVKGYPYVCYECDENKYKVETHKKGTRIKTLLESIGVMLILVALTIDWEQIVF